VESAPGGSPIHSPTSATGGGDDEGEERRSSRRRCLPASVAPAGRRAGGDELDRRGNGVELDCLGNTAPRGIYDDGLNTN
jgi:hypothetical protein